MKKHFFTAMMMLITSSSAWSAVNLLVPADIRVMSVDAQELKTGLVGTQQQEYKLDAGTHQIHVRYEQFFEHAHSGEHEIIKSDVLLIDTPYLQDGEQYRLVIPQTLKDVEQAQQFAKKPRIELHNQRGEVIAEQTLAQKQPLFGAGIFSRSYDLTKKKTLHRTTQPVMIHQNSSETQQVISSGKKGQQLIDTWNNATSADREAFLIWLNQQAR